MKKSLLYAGILFGFAAIFQGCKNDDTTPPVITIIGDNPYRLEMLQNYVEFGATAEDDADGNLTNSIDINVSEIDINLPATYEVHYEVSDAAGNMSDEHRQVIVYANAHALARTYSVLDTTIVGAATDPYGPYAQTVTLVNTNTIKFTKFADFLGADNITAVINEDGTIVLPNQTALNIGTAAEDHTFQGTGYVTPGGFYLNYINQNLTTSSNATVHAYFSR